MFADRSGRRLLARLSQSEFCHTKSIYVLTIPRSNLQELFELVLFPCPVSDRPLLSVISALQLTMQLICFLPLAAALLVKAYPGEGSGGWRNVYHISPGQSIQAAIDTASPYSVIEVAAGEYHEQLTISKDGITLRSNGAVLKPPASIAKNTCTGLAGGTSGAGICISGSNVKLAEFVQEHRKFISVGERVKNVVVSGFATDGFDGMGVGVVGAEDTHVDDSTFLNGPLYGFLAVGSIRTSLTQASVVHGEGLGFIAICTDDVKDSKVLHSRAVTGYYIGLCCQTPGALYLDNHVSGNCVGAFVDPGITGAQIKDNHIGATNPACVGTPVVGGVVIYGAINTVVEGNTIQGQHAGDVAGGIVLVDATDISPSLVASGNKVSGNVLSDNDFDIFVNSTGIGNVVASNQCATCV